MDTPDPAPVRKGGADGDGECAISEGFRPDLVLMRHQLVKRHISNFPLLVNTDYQTTAILHLHTLCTVRALINTSDMENMQRLTVQFISGQSIAAWRNWDAQQHA